MYLIKDYQRLKSDESSHLNLEWNLNRELSKVNYQIHTDAIKSHLIPKKLDKSAIGFKYATEADRLNMALFGLTAKDWKINNPNLHGNIRDNANVYQLLVLSNLESLNSEFIKDGKDSAWRTDKLNQVAKDQMEVLLKNKKDELESKFNNRLQ